MNDNIQTQATILFAPKQVHSSLVVAILVYVDSQPVGRAARQRASGIPTDAADSSRTPSRVGPSMPSMEQDNRAP
jgi:hypothetical protein